MKFVNYYKILNISPSATADEVKKSYRKLALQYHPDRNKGKTSVENFKKITEAYNILKDPALRKAFDRQFATEIKVEEKNTTTSANPKAKTKRGTNLKYHLKVSLLELTNGTTKKITYVRSTLKGDVEQTLSIEVPPLSYSGQRLKVNFMGDDSKDGGPNGDLFIIVESQDDGFIQRHGFNAIATVPITFYEAIQGAEIEFYWQSDIIRIETPPGLPNGFQKNFKGKGLQSPETGKRGDLIVKIIVEIPSIATEEQKALLKEITNRLPASSLRKSFLSANIKRNF